MKGSELKDIVKNSGVKLAELVDKSGIPQKTIYNLYAKDQVEDHYLDKLSKAIPGLKKLPKVAKEEPNDDLAAVANKLLQRLDKSMTFHEMHLTDLQKNNDELIDINRAWQKTNDAVIDSSKVLTKIVYMVLDAGALKVDKSKAIDLLSKIP